MPDQLVSELKEEDVHLLLVAVTPPHGDDMGEELLRTGFNGIVVNVGGAVDMMTASGRSIAPRWIRSIKLEWVFRMAREPRRLWRRYILECLPAFATLDRAVLPPRPPSAPQGIACRAVRRPPQGRSATSPRADRRLIDRSQRSRCGRLTP